MCSPVVPDSDDPDVADIPAWLLPEWAIESGKDVRWQDRASLDEFDFLPYTVQAVHSHGSVVLVCLEFRVVEVMVEWFLAEKVIDCGERGRGRPGEGLVLDQQQSVGVFSDASILEAFVR